MIEYISNLGLVEQSFIIFCLLNIICFMGLFFRWNLLILSCLLTALICLLLINPTPDSLEQEGAMVIMWSLFLLPFSLSFCGIIGYFLRYPIDKIIQTIKKIFHHYAYS